MNQFAIFYTLACFYILYYVPAQAGLQEVCKIERAYIQCYEGGITSSRVFQGENTALYELTGEDTGPGHWFVVGTGTNIDEFSNKFPLLKQEAIQASQGVIDITWDYGKVQLIFPRNSNAILLLIKMLKASRALSGAGSSSKGNKKD